MSQSFDKVRGRLQFEFREKGDVFAADFQMHNRISSCLIGQGLGGYHPPRQVLVAGERFRHCDGQVVFGAYRFNVPHNGYCGCDENMPLQEHKAKS